VRRKPLVRTAFILTLILAACNSEETASGPAAQPRPTQIGEIEADAITAETDEPEDGQQEGVYQSAYQKGYDEGFAEGAARCNDGLEANYDYEFEGEDEQQMGHYNGFGEGYYDGYDACADAGEHGAGIDDVEAEERQQGAKEDDATPQRQDDVAAGQTTQSTQTMATEATTPAEETSNQTKPAPPASLASGIAPFPNLFLNPENMLNDRDTLPRTDLILVSPPDGTGMVAVTGQSGAVPFGQPERPWDSVNVIAVEWGTQDCVNRRHDGSFDARLEAPAGSTLYVLPIQSGNCIGQGIQTGPAAVLTVPETTSSPSAISATLGRAGSQLKWTAQGSLTGPGGIEFVVHEKSGDECLIPRIHLYRLFDGDGGYLSQVNVNVHGPALTPTGLPIESDNGSNGYYDVIEFMDAPDCLEYSQTLTPSSLPASLEPGWYLPRIIFGLRSSDNPLEFGVNTPDFQGTEFEGNTGFGYLPMVGVGTPPTPRLPTTLLNEAPSWGSAGIRGVVAEEDAGRFALGSRRSVIAPFIASPIDPLSGQSVHYTLEPYLPTVGYTGFAASLPEVLFGLDADNPGTLNVTLTTPDGTTTDLAGNAKVEMFVASAWFAGYPVLLPFSGPSHTVGLTTHLDGLDIYFDQPGLHTVRLDGTLLSSRGDEFIIEGTYDIWVAEPLDLSLGVFEGTPLEVGDAWNPTVVVEPGVPAEITIDISHYPDGNPARRQNNSITGTANRFGYFASDQAWRPTEHGEYLVEVTASYLDPVDGTLWMGARSSASIVATPNTEIIAHAERNSELAKAAGDQMLRTWFFNRTVDPTCGEAACDPIVAEGARGIGYPFFSGDVVWVADMTPLSPVITVNGPANVLTNVAPQLRPQNYCWIDECFEALDTNHLYSDTNSGSGIHHRPNDVTSWAYWYSTSMRPGVSVFSAVAEGKGGVHNTWYGHDTYSCQIGLPCRDFYFTPDQGGRGGSDTKGDEEGDFKLLFGGAVIKNGGEAHFAPYASMAVLIKEAEPVKPDGFLLRDDKGNRICPPYQGAAGGPANCGPLLTHRGRDVDLFITPTGTRPGNVLEPGDLFTFSGQAWPTLDVAVEVTVTAPDGEVRRFTDRANTVGYVDADAMSFIVDEPGVYEVHVSATQDRPIPSTGLAPDPALVADGRTTMDIYGYQHPLSAVLGAEDSTYRFYVVETVGNSAIGSDTSILHGNPGPDSIFGWAGNYVEKITFTHELPPGVTRGHYSLTAPGLLIEDGAISDSGTLTVDVDQDDLYETGFTQIILGADTLQLSIAYQTEDGWQARTLNQRGFSPLQSPAELVPSSSESPAGLTGCLPDEKELFSSNFESGSAGWDFSDNQAWSVVQAQDSKALRGAGHVHAFAGANWDEVVWRMRVKLSTGQAHLNFHASNGQRYLISFGQDWTQLIRDKPLAQASIPHRLEEWHVVEISLHQDVLRIAVDGVLEIEYAETDSLPPGGIWLEVLDKSVVLFDDVYVCEPPQ